VIELLCFGAQVAGWLIAGGLVVLLVIALLGEAPEPKRPDEATLDAYRRIGQIHEAALMRMLAVIWDADA
jgi:hypothetical protein